MQVPGPSRVASPNYIKRLIWLLACILVGLVIGITGSSLSGNPVWYVAVPAAVGAGWLFFANPTECEPPAHQPAKGSPGDETAP
jgi:hypothetical protein